MFDSKRIADAPAALIDPIHQIVATVCTLVAPSQSLYYACNRERVEKQAEQLATLDVELENIRAQALEAGARLSALHQETQGEGVAL